MIEGNQKLMTKFFKQQLNFCEWQQIQFSHWINGGDWAIVDWMTTNFWAKPKTFLNRDQKNSIAWFGSWKFSIISYVHWKWKLSTIKYMINVP